MKEYLVVMKVKSDKRADAYTIEQDLEAAITAIPNIVETEIISVEETI